MGATRAALDAHLLAPLQAVRDELFTTFRSRPSIVSLAEYEADRDSLARMLGDFERDRGSAGGAGGGGAGPGAPPPAAGDAVLVQVGRLLEGRNVEDGDARLMPAPRGGGPPPKVRCQHVRCTGTMTPPPPFLPPAGSQTRRPAAPPRARRGWTR